MTRTWMQMLLLKGRWSSRRWPILRQPLQIHFRLLPRRRPFKIGIDFRPFVEETAIPEKESAVLHPASVIQAVAFAGGSVGSEVGTS